MTCSKRNSPVLGVFVIAVLGLRGGTASRWAKGGARSTAKPWEARFWICMQHDGMAVPLDC